MFDHAGLYSYLFAFIAYLVTGIALFSSTKIDNSGTPIKVAVIATCSWAILITASYSSSAIPAQVIQIVEIIRNLAWCFFILKIISPKQSPQQNTLIKKLAYSPLILATAIAILSSMILFGNNATQNTPSDDPASDIPLIAWMLLSITGLLLIEQVYRNSNKDQRWFLKHLCLGLGSIFAYDFFMYADALLFKHLDNQLWDARGIINGIAAPLIMTSLIRNPSWILNIQVSRKVVFHTATLTGAGIYLVLMSGAGYFIRYYGGTWGSILQITFLFGAGLLLFILLFSDKIRSSIRVLLSKHFFSYKYDYREEWQKFTHLLSEYEQNTPERICAAIGSLVQSKGGIIWGRDEHLNYQLLTNWEMAPPELPPSHLKSIGDFFERTEWVIDFDEYRLTPGIYDDLIIPSSLLEIPNAWLMIPLLFNAEVYGFVLVKHSDIQKNINWEDRDLLKIAGKQAASLLAQYQASQALIQAQQFEAFNRLSAYIVHDLKNILAQQSLIISNAEKHKHKPEFVDDVILTVRNSVNRMTRLMEQMRNGMRGTTPVPVDLKLLLKTVCKHYEKHSPAPVYSEPEYQAFVFADNEQLANVFGHLIQNAQEATDIDGRIDVQLTCSPHEALIEITDNGKGMDENFIQHRLFKAFDSTKGLTGMGVGAFESREVVRSLGGDIQVKSSPGIGTSFYVTLPLHYAPTTANNIPNEASQSK
ncbi:XrtA/PEP-CTERM system histidine kinase PrsK [Neptunomonas qingdaonensis]|uniref:histidine kinase n=1 Tax=Neptunomonas qingdaonensis TaxID=1045558 RepID=A0A1I2MZB4_9GAMM|nr:XrtA/PEP-CTERM system histidine kinase PrsK [Neptunomonas qingdaonensis]SFF94451.1 putative PEP-CTERM system histidine kinase [Neptunomonas qingdaonensis]